MSSCSEPDSSTLQPLSFLLSLDCCCVSPDGCDDESCKSQGQELSKSRSSTIKIKVKNHQSQGPGEIRFGSSVGHDARSEANEDAEIPLQQQHYPHCMHHTTCVKMGPGSIFFAPRVQYGWGLTICFSGNVSGQLDSILATRHFPLGTINHF